MESLEFVGALVCEDYLQDPTSTKNNDMGTITLYTY